MNIKIRKIKNLFVLEKDYVNDGILFKSSMLL